MQSALYILLGAITGGVVAYLFATNKRKAVETLLALSRQEAAQTKDQLLQQLKQEQDLSESLRQDIADSKAETDKYREQLTQTKMHLERANAKLEAEQKQREQDSQLMREQFANLATKVLDHTTHKLKTQNTESMKHITDPLKQNIEQLQQAINNTNTETARQTASLSQQIKDMGEQTAKMKVSADRLTNVIRGGNKAQGNWGERMLTEILQGQGFREGYDFDVQTVINENEEGRRLVPDVVLHYPNNEDVIIDSKMSIDAFYKYANTEDEVLRRNYAAELVKSIRTQMTNLSRKDYSAYIKPPRRAIDFVIMFVPNEGALQLALATDPRLWGEAFDKQVLITSQQNLMAILKIIQIAWRQYTQTENQKRVYSLAEELLKRVGEFVKRFDKVGKDIETLHRNYDDAYNKAYTGRQSIVQKANELKELGVKENANLPIPQTTLQLE